MANSWFTDIENFFVTTEADVQNIIAQIVKGVQVAENDLLGAIRWVANQAPGIAADIQSVVSFVQLLGIMNPTVQAAINDANAAVVALNAFAAAEKNQTSAPSAVIAGYVAVKQAIAASSTASAAAATAVKPAA